MSGNTATSIRKKDLSGQRNTGLGYKNLAFAHQATAGDTLIPLGSLILPSSLAANGFTNPSASEIAAIDIYTYRKNLQIISSVNGLLMQDLAYRVSTNNIQLIDYVALDGEIFRCEMISTAKTGLRAIDGRSTVTSGTLPAGQTDFNVGSLFEINKYPTAQIGSVLVDEDGFLQRRNTSNGLTGGNYQEVDNGTGYGTIIRFNAPTIYDREIAVYSNGILLDKPSQSHSQEIERLQGQIDGICDVLADAAGVSVQDLKNAATQPDLKAFGDAVLDLQRSAYVATAQILTSKRFQRILVDTTAGSFTLTLPASPSLGDRVMVVDAAGTWGTNNLILGRNGSNIIGIADDFGCDTSNSWVELVYFNPARGWLVRA